MGFGVLFAGYFLILNIAYFLITDVIAAAMMALGLSKLAYLNRGFKAAFTCSIVFLVFSIIEFGFGAYEMLFSYTAAPELVSYGAIARNVLLCILSFTAFDGMREVSKEVELDELAKRSRCVAFLALPVFIFAIVAETPVFFAHISPYVAAVISVAAMLATIAYHIFGLTVIYKCYANIFIPENDDEQHNSSNKKKKNETFAEAYRRQRDDRQAAKAQMKKKK